MAPTFSTGTWDRVVPSYYTGGERRIDVSVSQLKEQVLRESVNDLRRLYYGDFDKLRRQVEDLRTDKGPQYIQYRDPTEDIKKQVEEKQEKERKTNEIIAHYLFSRQAK